MTNYSVDTFPGAEIQLYNNPLEMDDLQLAAKAIEFLEEFYSFLQPLSADLMVRFRDLDWLPVNEIEPLLPHWHIQASSAPSYVIVETGITNPNPQVSQSPKLSSEVLFNWIKTALNQNSPNPQYRMTWWQIHINSTRTRLFDESKLQERQLFLFNSTVVKLHIPVESLEDGLWVSGPVKELIYVPPVSFLLSQQYGGLSAKLIIHWPLWTQPNYIEQTAFQGAVSRLLDKGWESSSKDDD